MAKRNVSIFLGPVPRAIATGTYDTETGELKFKSSPGGTWQPKQGKRIRLGVEGGKRKLSKIITSIDGNDTVTLK